MLAEKMADLDCVKKWFDIEVARLQERIQSDGYPKGQFVHDLESLRMQRDERMRAIEDIDEVEASHDGEGAGGVKHEIGGSQVKLAEDGLDVGILDGMCPVQHLKYYMTHSRIWCKAPLSLCCLLT